MKTKTKLAAGMSAALAVGALVGTGVAGAGHTNILEEARLNGRQEVPTSGSPTRQVGDPDGFGEAYVFGIDGDATTLCYVLTVNKIATATGAHIHEGVRGENGPIVANLAAPADGNAADCLTEGEVGPGTTPKFPTGETVADILANPAGYYVNVHNANFPGGAIRGQLRAER